LISEGLPREPLLGFGFMRIDYKEFFQSTHTYPGKMTHNTFMQVLMNLGFVGLDASDIPDDIYITRHLQGK
jgi:exopolysaccharide production protein ExoQ